MKIELTKEEWEYIKLQTDNHKFLVQGLDNFMPDFKACVESISEKLGEKWKDD